MKPGTRLRSAVCTTEVIVVSAPKDAVELCCGGQPMLERETDGASSGSLDAAWASGTALGKRYHHAATLLEALCTKSGKGSLSVNGEALEIKVPKALPASD